MPIPDFDHNGVMLPHTGNPARERKDLSPYPATTIELCQKWRADSTRRGILLGLLELREALRSLGVTAGFQWLDGSFMEAIESNEGRPPNDIDVVTFYSRPSHPIPTSLLPLVQTVTNRRATKAKFKVDHILVPLTNPPEMLVDEARYWYGLFSHRRDHVWKGMLQIDLATSAEDTIARQMVLPSAP